MRQARHLPGGDSDPRLGVTIVVLNSEEVQGELMRDMTEALTLRCARLCGRRQACKHADAAIWAVEGAL
jgi:predicted site-specific integrase-resolvase